MENQQTHKLFVCTTCASTWEAGKRIGISGGEKLLAELVNIAETWNLKEQFTIEPVSCMSACSQNCVVSFSALSKFTYLFGNLAYSDAIAILNCADNYYAKSDGLLPWADRPEPLKKGILAKIPMI
jgi:predicted metal-binding protein